MAHRRATNTTRVTTVEARGFTFPGVKASRGYDHRGHCTIFEHETLEIGKNRLNQTSRGKDVIQSELYKGPADTSAKVEEQRKRLFEQVLTTINTCFDENFPE